MTVNTNVIKTAWRRMKEFRIKQLASATLQTENGDPQHLLTLPQFMHSNDQDHRLTAFASSHRTEYRARHFRLNPKRESRVFEVGAILCVTDGVIFREAHRLNAGGFESFPSVTIRSNFNQCHSAVSGWLQRLVRPAWLVALRKSSLAISAKPVGVGAASQPFR